MNEIKKQLLAKMGDTTEKKYSVIKRVNDSLDSKPQKVKKFAWGYYITFASFVGIFILGLIFLPNLLNEQSAINDEDPSEVDPVTDPMDDTGYYEELKQFFPPDGTVATYDVVDFYATGSIVTTKWLSDRYVLQVSKGINCPECSKDGKGLIYRITNEQIELINDGDSREDWTIEELDSLPTLSVIFKAPIEVGTQFNGLQITSTNATVSTKYGDFTNAILIEEIEGYEYEYAVDDEFDFKKYYVPGYGIVKTDVNSQHSGSSELVSISFGNEISQENDYSDLLKSYFFPPEDLDLFFIGGFENSGVKVQTKWLSEKFVQQISYHGGGTIEKIYKITNNQIEIIYETMIDGSTPSNMTIGELEQLPTIDIVMKAPFTVGDVFGEYTLIDTNGEVGTMYSTFENVIVLESETENYLSRKYYAIGFGEVKIESMFYNEETGQYEEGVTTELSSIDQIMNEVVGNYLFRVFEEEQYNYNSIDEDEISPLNTKRAILHGRADFEGLNRLVIEDLETGKFTIYKYRYEGEQNTPKDIKWIDEERLFVIIGYGYGTITKGGSLYILNVKDHSITPVFENIFENNGKEEIMSIEANGDGTFTYKKHIYDDAEFNVGHIEEGSITP
ncbi:DUF4652 domain-containing protein [Ureibacillus sp. MALMAid1270]|uniref:DUF4652 domain-containing protein n=1 Tax=Ureibacillus sp. MALMAid1270 TaxID=3411629 RepID=UPI003BA81582